MVFSVCTGKLLVILACYFTAYFDFKLFLESIFQPHLPCRISTMSYRVAWRVARKSYTFTVHVWHRQNKENQYNNYNFQARWRRECGGSLFSQWRATVEAAVKLLIRGPCQKPMCGNKNQAHKLRFSILAFILYDTWQLE